MIGQIEFFVYNSRLANPFKYFSCPCSCWFLNYSFIYISIFPWIQISMLRGSLKMAEWAGLLGRRVYKQIEIQRRLLTRMWVGFRVSIKR